jgi:hypothetical protein
MRDNYEELISLSNGDWITIIGQDDLLAKDALDKFRKIEKKNNKAQIITSPRSYFFWDDESRDKRRIYSIENYGIGIVTKHKSKKRHFKTILGLVHYNTGPQLYSGTFIKRDLINLIKTEQGRIFAGNIPDVYSSIVLLRYSEYFYKYWRSLAIVGTSANSVGYKISQAVEEKKFVSIDIQKEFFSKNLESNPGNNGTIVSFVFYHFEELKIFLKKNKMNGSLNFLNKKIVLSIIYASTACDIYTSSLKKNRHQILTLHKLSKKKRLIFPLVLALSVVIYLSKKIGTLLRYFYYLVIYLFGRYKINKIGKKK